MAVSHIPRDGVIKCCSRCGKIKPIESFSDSTASYCDECKRYYTKGNGGRIAINRWQQKNREKLVTSRRLFYKKNREKEKLHYAENAEEIKQSEGYIRGLIKSNHKIPYELINEEMIEREKTIQKIKRTVREIKENGESETYRRGNVGSSPDEELRSLFSLLS